MSDVLGKTPVSGPLVSEADDSPWRQRFDSIYKVLRRRIVLLDYQPGTRLDVDVLASEFNVSRTPVRSVIQQLGSEGLAVTRHGVGTAVTDVDVEQVRDVWLFRIQLAEMIGRLSPRPGRVTIVDQLDQLRDVCAGLTRHTPSREFAEVDIRLHDFKCHLVGNAQLRRTYDEMYYRSVRAWFQILPELNFDVERSALMRDISQTANAVRRGDVAAVGFITRNAVSDGLFRMDTLTSGRRAQPGPPLRGTRS